ncbi:phage major capsid protein [Thiotrichales bacterium 19S3-7]|nr:phage major capsid protein [Thiotrichales bacterium 19S3-7]MCF6802552.1 phage major capsid protein [Thiotrichales bacterium 19S3-11]
MEKMTKSKIFKRSAVFEYRAEDNQNNDEDRTLILSFSSTSPVARWNDVDEVLLHENENVDFSRLKNGAPLLFNHDWNRQIGVIEDVWIRDEKGYAKVRFSKQGFGDEVYKDVKDGIIRNISVGYHVNETKFSQEAMTLFVTRWLPFEISFAPVPADTSVGVGRSLNEDFSQYQITSNRKELVMSDERSKEVVKSYEEGQKEERERTDAIYKLADENKMTEFARSYVKDGSSFDKFERDMYKQMANNVLLANRRKETQENQIESTAIGMNNKEVRNYSILKAVRAMAEPTNTRAQKDAAMEFEASEAFKRDNHIYDTGFAIPSDVLMRDFAVSGEGGNLVPTTLQSNSFVDMLRNRSVVIPLAQRMSGLKGNIKIPKQTAGSQVYWVNEGEEVDEGHIGTGLIELSPKTLGAFLDITEEMMINASPDAETIVRNDLVAQMALGIDTAALYGQGGNSKQPLGLFNAGVPVYEYLEDAPTFDDYVSLETKIATSNADVNSMRYLINPKLKGKAKTTSKKLNQDSTIWETGGTINGYQTHATNQVQSDHIFFGNFNDLIIGLWAGLILRTDPYTKMKAGVLTVVARQNVDFAIRREESFALAQKQVNQGE